MEEYILSQQAFDRLWARVHGETPAQPPERSELAVLRRFLEETAETLLFERCLAQLPGMNTLCRETRSRLIRLETAYYLLTAERYRRPAVCPLREGVLPALRRACLAALARAADYTAESAKTTEPLLAELYQELAGEEQAHAAALKRRIGALLG